MKPRASQMASVLIALLAGTCAVNASAADTAPAKGKGAAPTPSPQVTTQQRQFLTIEAVGPTSGGEVLSLPARAAFRPQAQFAVGAMVPGRVSALLVRSGETVKAGAPLLTIESGEAAGVRTTLDQAATRLASAELVHRRHVLMVEKGVGLEVERQDAEARLKEARLEYERARHGSDLVGGGKGVQVTVRAPAGGTVMSIRTAIGATVAPGGEALLEIGDPTRLQVVGQVAEGDLARIAAGQEAEVELAALNTTVRARVEGHSPRVDPESRRAQVYFTLSQPVEGLRAGMLARASVRVAGAQGIVVPVAAVLIKDGRTRIVYVERSDGSFEAREVQVGRSQDGRVAILKGLNAGERVVVRGALLLDSQAQQLL